MQFTRPRYRCIVCGMDDKDLLEHCDISPCSELNTQVRFNSFRELSCDGVVMCAIHHAKFHKFHFFIHFLPDVQVFAFVNVSDDPILKEFDGKVVAIHVDPKDPYCANLAALFNTHEQDVRRHCSNYQPVRAYLPEKILWQDWMVEHTSDGELHGSTFTGSHHSPFTSTQPPAWSRAADAPSTGKCTISLNGDISNDIAIATHKMASWSM